MTPSLPRYIFQHHASPVVYCGFVVCAGTSNEEPDDLGMAHFLEHMSFKGTRRRRAYHINSFLERVGGDLNAFTNKVETVFHATVLRRDFARAVDLLADVVFNSQYPEHEIQREVEVICDEIDSYEDSPSELIFDHFEQILFKGHPLGRDILGTKERLRQYHTADAHRFASRYYRPENVVFFAYGDLDEATVRRTLARYMPQDLPALPQFTLPTFAPLPPHAGGDTIIVNKNTHQAHVIVGTRAVGGHDERRYALSLLNNILGGLEIVVLTLLVTVLGHGAVVLDPIVQAVASVCFWCHGLSASGDSDHRLGYILAQLILHVELHSVHAVCFLEEREHHVLLFGR